MRDIRYLTRSFGLIGGLMLSICIVRSSAAVATEPTDIYRNVVAQFLNGNWDDLPAVMKSHAREIAALPAAQKSDVDYIRRTILECRPAWWAECKAGKLDRFRPVLWGRGIAAVYDPSAASPVTINYLNDSSLVTIKWNAADMDNPAVKGELEFTQGEHVDLDIWRNLGTAESWSLIPPRQQINLTEAEKKKVSRYLSFRGFVAGAYYATPRARRLALWEGISGWSHEYDKKGMYMPMRAIGILFATEVLSRPETYKSVPWPKEPPADGAESKMIWELQKWIRYHELPLSEDRALRDAFKTFAAINAGRTLDTGLVILPNKLKLSLDPDADKPLSVLRDKWIKERYGKASRP